MNIREIYLHDPSRESAVRIRHNSHCRDKAADREFHKRKYLM